jgi:hypothetical protein
MISTRCGIYALENLLRPRVYVGAAHASFAQRRNSHFSHLHNRWHVSNDELNRDARRYGACAFRFLILQELPSHLNFAPFEQFWITYLTSMGVRCYNVMPAYDHVYHRQRRARLAGVH